MNFRLTSIAIVPILAAITSGCIIIDGSECFDCVEPAPVVNHAPEIWDGLAGCYYDGYERDDIWYFEATVDDLDGIEDVHSVWADVYDETDGSLVESFELFPTEQAGVYFSDWLGSTTYLYCGLDIYTVDLVAYDVFDAVDSITLLPEMD